MISQKLTNINVKSHTLLPTPNEVRAEIPVTAEIGDFISQGRQSLMDILDGKDPRLVMVVGPCSIHDLKAASEYAQKLHQLSKKIQDRIVVLMRVYFEKPRTTVGWKGLINDPYLDDSFHIEQGIKIARKLLLELAEMGLLSATEALDPIIPQYISDLLAWTAIGARTTESQTHREMASGLSTPIGFKNGTDGNIGVAINAMKSCLSPHNFLGISSEGRISVYETKGNPYSHVVLRGGKGPNYDTKNVAACESALSKAGLREKIMIDCSHGNSDKDYRNQPKVFRDVMKQILDGNSSIIGMMVESHLSAGNQKISEKLDQLQYGVSVTDQCIDWETTEELLLEAHGQLASR